MKRILDRLTYANVMATVAVFIALGGVSYAAIKLPKNSVGAKQLKKGAVTASKLKDDSVTAAAIAPNAITKQSIDLNSIGTVPRATTAQSAATADSAKNATHADSASQAATATTAGNASQLGGIPASGYTRNDCDSLTGQIKGFAKVNGPALASAGKFETTGVEVPYNCSGEAVVATRLDVGKYQVKFLGNPAAIAVASPLQNEGFFFLVNSESLNQIGPGEFEVQLWNDVGNALTEGSFSIILP